MDPALLELMLYEADPDEEIEAIIRLANRGQAPPGIREITRFGEIITCRVKRKDVQSVYESPLVLSFKAPRAVYHDGEYLEDNEWDALSEDPGEAALVDPALTGKGVVIGIIDSGADFAHVDFVNPDRSSRFISIWDQSHKPDGSSPLPYGYGKVYDRDKINAALKTETPYHTLGYHPGVSELPIGGTHGTHVTGIAAANGRSGQKGLAPEADIVFVHQGGSNTMGQFNMGDTVGILEAFDFIKKQAGNQPLVINMSLGTQGGPHDGTTLVEKAIDIFLDENPNTVICQSTGNYYSNKTHCAGIILPGAEEEVSFIIVPGKHKKENEIELWYSGSDEFGISLSHSSKKIFISCDLGSLKEIIIDGNVEGRIYHRSRDPNNGRNHIDIFLYPGAPTGLWVLKIAGKKITDGRFNAWIEKTSFKEQSHFTDAFIVRSSTTNSICNAHNSIVVGAYDQADPLAAIAPFSSSGPTIDGRIKPHVLAPGVQILSSRASSLKQPAGSNQLFRMDGTSMACPFMTGVVALILQGITRPATIHDIRNIVFRSCTAIERKSPDEQLRGGYGIIDLSKIKKNIDWFNKQATSPSIAGPKDKGPTRRLAPEENLDAIEYNHMEQQERGAFSYAC